MLSNSLPIGFKLHQKYSIQKPLGQGGFGITYLAQNTILDVDVCIKELFITGSSSRGQNLTVITENLKDFSFSDFKERFLQEAKQLAKFNHNGIVKVIDFFEENNTAYVVMEYLKGQTLKDLVANNGPLDFEASKDIINQLLNAVEVVHNAGMLHRDIKPENLIITEDRRVVLIDFGSARAFTEGKTVAQTAMVSPGYAPLEQYNPNARKGTFTDIYSIGATFYFMLTGQKPLNVTERYTEKLKAPHELNTSVSLQISSAVLLAMEMKPEDRFQNVKDFREGLKLLSGLKITKENSKSTFDNKSESIDSNLKVQKNKNYFLPLVLIIAILCFTFYFYNQGSTHVEESPKSENQSSPQTQSEPVNKIQKWYSYNYYGNNVTEYIDEIYKSANGDREFYYYTTKNSDRIYMKVYKWTFNGSEYIYGVKLGDNPYTFIISGDVFRCVESNGGIQNYFKSK
jgi:serine/threonine protein kinase